MAPTQQKLKLVLFTLAFLRWIKRGRKRSTRTTWVKSWITRRNEQGVYNNLIKELGNKDPTGVRPGTSDYLKKISKKYSRYCPMT